MDSEDKRFVLVLALIIVGAISLTAIEKCESTAHASEPVDSEAFNIETDAKRVDNGIKYLLRKVPYWGLSADPKRRSKMAMEITAAAYSYQIPPLLLTVMVKRESSFDPKAIGKSRGERGLLQVHSIASRGCRLDTVSGQLACGASWLRRAYETCDHDWRGAVTMYMSGHCGARESSKLHTAVTSRLRQWARLERLSDGS